MNAEIIDGKTVAANIRSLLKKRVEILAKKEIIPGLAVILCGLDPASVSYVTAKEKACAELGMKSFDFRITYESTTDDILALIEQCNQNPEIHGILVQLPLPPHIDERKVIESINSEKDVDGFTPINVGKMVLGEEAYIPCTPHGVIKLLESKSIETKGKHVVIVGRSNIVGKPLMNLMVRKEINATVSLCHTGTRNLAEFTRQADILIACAGKPNLITKDMIKEGAVVIDVGVNRVPDSSTKTGYRLRGDCDFESLLDKASFITPVPGGVGPMTITMLLFNTIESAEKK